MDRSRAAIETALQLMSFRGVVSRLSGGIDMTYKSYEVTAFTEADLLTGNDKSLGCGDSFTMPGSATTCITVKDNDVFLSGDSRRNENSDDKKGQTASITGENGEELGNGGQIYAEFYYWVCDTEGNWYVMIEIEQERTNDDFYTFYTGHGYDVPPEGAELTVYSRCNVSGNWLDYKCLDAGEKEEKDPWAFDEDTCTYTVEAECWDLHNFKVVDGDQASGGELVKISGNDGKISTDFGGESGVYNMTICAQDETDGVSKLMIYVNGEFQQTVKLNQQSDGGGSNNGGFSEFTLNGLEIAEGDKVEIRAWKDGGEFVRIDAIKFEQVKFEECDLPGAVKLDFEGFAAGDVLTDLDGLTISATGGSGEAMIFDSQNPTGGDGDLETQVAQLGNVLIVSEDGDSSDPDDVVGGTITFDFDNPSTIFDLKFIDTEEGGTVTLTLADGSTQTFDVPELVNGGVGQLVMDVENVVSMEVALDGSGAIDDLCWVPGEPPLGSLSGRYFCDVNRDDVDNNEPGVAGIVVYLLDANGNRTGESTTTDSDGNYSFTDLEAGTYGVEFAEAPAGKTFVSPNAGNDDSIDSDAIANSDGSATISTIVVVAGENTPDNDVGVEFLPGSLSGRYFCDDDRDGLDNDGPNGTASAGIAGVVVMLLDAGGNAAVDIDGNPVAAVMTDSDGNYSFGNLAAGDYSVKFTDPNGVVDGKFLTTANVDADNNGVDDDDALDSDAIGDSVMSQIDNITVVAGQDTPDNDAGVFPNEAPTASNDMGMACVGDDITIDLSDNYEDTDSASVSITMLGGVNTAGNGSFTLDGVADLAGGGTFSFEDLEVTRSGDTFVFDGTDAFSELLIGQKATASFEFKVVDSDGASVTASVDVAFCGAKNTLDTIADNLPTSLQFTLDLLTEDNFIDAYTMQVSGSGDARFDGMTFEAAYCIDATLPITTTILTTADVSVANEANALAAGLSAQAAADIDLVNWIINQDFTSQDNGDGLGDTYTDLEVQEAVWSILNGQTFAINTGALPAGFADDDEDGVREPGENGTLENVAEIVALAEAQGEGFEAGEGQLVGLILDPTSPSSQQQPFLIAVEFDELAQDCFCF